MEEYGHSAALGRGSVSVPPFIFFSWKTTEVVYPFGAYVSVVIFLERKDHE